MRTLLPVGFTAFGSTARSSRRPLPGSRSLQDGASVLGYIETLHRSLGRDFQTCFSRLLTSGLLLLNRPVSSRHMRSHVPTQRRSADQTGLSWSACGSRDALRATTAILLITLLGGMPRLSAGQTPGDPVREVEALTLQWTDLERQKDILQANWRTDKPILEQQLLLFEREARELDAYLETSAQQQDEVEQRRLELLEEQTRLEREQDALERSLAQASRGLETLHPQLPPPLFEAWTEDLPRLRSPLLTPTEKLQLMLELLEQLDDFQRKITLHQSVMTMADGRDYEVKQVYLGLSHGWYVTADGRFGAAGAAGTSGWQWTAVTDNQAITDIVGILERRVEPALVSIPLKLNAPTSADSTSGN
jgi:hypothetical protein